MLYLASLIQDPERKWSLIVFVALLCLLILAWISNDLNFAWSTGTQSRALYVDEGFYSDAAQNLVKFGHWEMAHDSRHWPGSPLTALIQSVGFSLFGVSTTVARLLSVFFGLLGLWAFYSMARSCFTPALSALLTFGAITPITYITIARSAIVDPLALSMWLLAAWVFCCMPQRRLAVPLSLALAFLSFFAKMYFLFAFATLIALWLGELLLVPVLFRQTLDRKQLTNFFISLLAIGLIYLGYRFAFSDQINQFLAINANKKPSLDPYTLYVNIRRSFSYLPYYAQAHVLLEVLKVTLLFMFVYSGVRLVRGREKFPGWMRLAGSITRAEWAMLLFLVSGLITVGSLKLLKTHYQFFAILPFTFLVVALVYRQFPRVVAAYINAGIILFHVSYQVPYYQDWLTRPNNDSIALASRDMVRRIEQAEANHELIPVLGEYSAQLGLYSDRVTSIDSKWITPAALCERLRYWRPRYHVNLVWPKSRSSNRLGTIKQCPVIRDYEEIARYNTFRDDYLVLTRLDYTE